jgi:hypothetical protein
MAQCRGGRCVGLFDGERLVVLTFRHRGSETDPVGLQLPEARRLISELIRVLLAYGDDYAFALSRAAWNSGGGAVATAVDDPRTCPSCQGDPQGPEVAAPGRRKGPKVKPSRRAGAPKGPILATEAWTLHRLLRNVTSHADFLRFIGADGPDNAATSNKPHSSPKKRKPSRPLRAKRRKK